MDTMMLFPDLSGTVREQSARLRDVDCLPGVSADPLSWHNRGKGLSGILRYKDPRPDVKRMEVMFYRTNDFIHAGRVEALVREILPWLLTIYPDLDPMLMILIARHHDDIELQKFLGDVPLQRKLKMSKKQRVELRSKELLAAEAMARAYRIRGKYPRRIGGYLYHDLLLRAIYKDCREAQIVSWIDKLDGLCESLHEVLAGNNVFLESYSNYLTKTFNKLPRNYPLIKKIFSNKGNPFAIPIFELCDFFDHGNRAPHPHTPETVARDTGFHAFEIWKRVTIEKFGIGALITQVELPRPH